MPSFPATISQEADSSVIVPVELLASIECEFMLQLCVTSSTNVMHVVNRSATSADKGLLAHESQQTLETDIAVTDATEFSDEADMLPQVSETGNNSELEADTDVSHGTRKRKRNPEKWAIDTRKKKAQSGEANESTCGYEVAALTPRSRPFWCTGAKGYKCSEFSAEKNLNCAKIIGSYQTIIKIIMRF